MRGEVLVERIGHGLEELIREILSQREKDEHLWDLVEHADRLRLMCMELIRTEDEVRKLQQFLEDEVLEGYAIREQAYLSRLAECQQVSRAQTELIASLGDLHQRLIRPQQPIRVPPWLGTCLGPGKVVHTFENQKGTREIVVAGFGLLGQLRYDYLFHVREPGQLRQHAFWIPDDQVETCQLVTCSTRFSWLQRKHHCRRCGTIVCSAHGANTLPFFKHTLPIWSRVCDACFAGFLYTQHISNQNPNNVL
ncbi:hypothetical protein BY458DRAFT_528370 [Sporodiniella umbellata]|nr:hypothetical protein BY458DRAFT_528370 [Sporodiniella umbellata]